MGKARTKEEHFILALYDAVEDSGDKDTNIAISTVQEELGFHDKSLKIICRNLAQANFIKKIGDTHIRLTPNGRALATQLLEE